MRSFFSFFLFPDFVADKIRLYMRTCTLAGSSRCLVAGDRAWIGRGRVCSVGIVDGNSAFARHTLMGCHPLALQI